MSEKPMPENLEPDERAQMIGAMMRGEGPTSPADPTESRPLDFHESVRATMLASFTLHLASWSLWIDCGAVTLDEACTRIDEIANTQTAFQAADVQSYLDTAKAWLRINAPAKHRTKGE